MPTFLRSFPFALAFAIFAFALANVASACPTCGNSIEASGSHLAEGFFYSILFMMSMPFVVFGGLATLFWLEIRKARRAAAAQSNEAGAAEAEPALR